VVDSVGQAPWAVESADLELSFKGMNLVSATVLDMNGMAANTVSLVSSGSETTMQFPSNAMYVILQSTGLNYGGWKDGYPWLDADTDSKEFADPEKDGLNNLLEYAFAGNPLAGEYDLFPRVTYFVDEGSVYLSMDFRKNNLASDLDYIVEASTDMIDWTEFGDNSADVSEEILNPDLEGDGAVSLIRVTHKFSENNVEDPIFLRLRITAIGAD
jgi:hypothetical protein